MPKRAIPCASTTATGERDERVGSQLQVDVWRGGADGRYQTFGVPRQDAQTVLDVVTWIQRRLDPTLAYRFACRVGMCGSCAMTVNGKARWTCRTHVARSSRTGALTIGAARQPADRAGPRGRYARVLRQVGARRGAVRADGRRRDDDFARVAPDIASAPGRRRAIECIGCGVCYASCDVVAWNPDYLGPAALNRAWTLVNDVRDGGSAARLAAVAGDAGCHACHTQMSCTERCPKQLSPTASIAGLKRAIARAALKGEL